MIRRTVFTADLEAYHLPSPLRRDMGQAYRGTHGDAQPTTVARMALSLDQAPVFDAANRTGHAARLLADLTADLYPNGSNQ